MMKVFKGSFGISLTRQHNSQFFNFDMMLASFLIFLKNGPMAIRIETEALLQMNWVFIYCCLDVSQVAM